MDESFSKEELEIETKNSEEYSRVVDALEASLGAVENSNFCYSQKLLGVTTSQAFATSVLSALFSFFSIILHWLWPSQGAAPAQGGNV